MKIRFILARMTRPRCSDLSRYTTALTKLIPGEVVSGYVAGRSLLQAGALGLPWWIGWSIFCFLAVIGLRRWMTSDGTANPQVPTEWSAVCTSAASFVVWVFSFGDLFELLGWWNKVGSALILIGWTLISPLVAFLLWKAFHETK
jgi:hypothetical protein